MPWSWRLRTIPKGQTFHSGRLYGATEPSDEDYLKAAHTVLSARVLEGEAEEGQRFTLVYEAGGRDTKVTVGAPGIDPEAFADECEELISQCGDLPEKAEEFGESVSEKAGSMAEWARENGTVTPRMATAMRNMKDGVERWLERSDR